MNQNQAEMLLRAMGYGLHGFGHYKGIYSMEEASGGQIGAIFTPFIDENTPTLEINNPDVRTLFAIFGVKVKPFKPRAGAC